MTRALYLLAAGLLIALCGCSQSHPRLSGSKWADFLRDPDAKVRKKAAFTLGNIGPSDPAVVPALTGALEDADPSVRCEAILALVKCGTAADEAVPTLEDMQKHDPDAKVRDYARQALENLRTP